MINYLFKQFRYFTKSSILPLLVILLTIISTIIFIIYYTPVILCDDNEIKVSLYQLKLSLAHHIEINDTYKAKISYYNNIHMIERNNGVYNMASESNAMAMIRHYDILKYHNMDEIIKLQEEIVKIDPNCKYPPSFALFYK